ncbi:MAG TPA: GNAT family N-acetyltransferase [Polyangia bacterium]|jgi:CelD/BcsL family acetyltransferase involved in cellulose biosynthesis
MSGDNPHATPARARSRAAATAVDGRPESTESDQVTALSNGEGFLALGPRWRELWSRSPEQSPFNSWEFVSTWWQHFILGRTGGATGEIEVLLARDQRGQIIGMSPMFVEHNMGQPELGRTLQPFGRSNSLETMTDEPMTVLHRQHGEQARAAMGAYLRDSAIGAEWDLAVTRSQVPSQAPPPSPPLRWNGPTVELDRLSPGTVAVPLAPTWEQYRRGLSKSMRDNVAYYPRRLQCEVGPFSVRIARRPQDVADAVDDLVRLHHLRSLGQHGTPHCSHISTAKNAAFFEEVMVRLARQGRASIATLTVAGRTIGAHAFLQTPNALWTYYSGFDPAWHRFSPLTIITSEVLRDAINRGVQQLCFSPGQAPWKSRWGGREVNQIQETSVYAIRPRALLRGVVRRLRWRAHAARRSVHGG